MADSASRAGQTYATPAILEHLARLHAPHDAALDTAFRANELHGIPGIQVGPHEGALLGWLLRGMEASRVVEIGTLAGFSGIHLGRALRAGGRLYSLEISEKHAAIARDNLRAAGLEDRAEVMLGDALASLAALSSRGPFDVIFVDADKGRYDQYARWAIDHLRPGGVLIADNVFYFGRLLEENPEAAAMRRFHELSATHLDTALVPTPDGLLLGRARPR
ncbi:MAG: O-methyltransferase [Deltaproteobacteria bacterium]|nr:O-methyltransferase [Deltaproteobacteria bacterium]